VAYTDGTKIESKADKYTFVRRKSVERNRSELSDKIRTLIRQIEDSIARDNAARDSPMEFTPEMLTHITQELKAALEQSPDTNNQEEKTRRRAKAKRLKEPENHRDKPAQYDDHSAASGEPNSYSKTHEDATFMRMKEDAMKNGRTKPGFNLQIGTADQFTTHFGLSYNPTDTLTLIPFIRSRKNRRNRFPQSVVAEAG
jgi:hypothetical protein